ncbi:MAG: diadenosine tetraphosphate hydrolase, partial [Nitrososphaerales archaeon]
TSIGRIKFVDGFSGKVEYNYRRAGKLVHKEVVYYLAKTETRDVKLSYEHKNYGWLEYEPALKRLTYRNSKRILEEANSFLKNARKESASLDSYPKK